MRRAFGARCVPPFRIEGRRRWSQIKEGYQPGAIIAPVHDPSNPWSTSVPIDQVTHRSQIYPNFKKDANGDDALEYIGNSSPTYTFTFGSTVKLSNALSVRALFRGEGNFLISRESELIRQNLGYNKVAADLAYAITNNSTLANQYMVRADERLREARFVDATENSLDTIEANEFSNSRL